jgi:acetylglutamate kinase
LQATLCYVSDVKGIYEEKNGEKQYVTCLDERQAKEWLTNEKITGGMIPKVEAALDALGQSVPEAVLISGTEKDALLRFCEGERVGTRFVRESEPKGVKTDDNECVTTVGP